MDRPSRLKREGSMHVRAHWTAASETGGIVNPNKNAASKTTWIVKWTIPPVTDAPVTCAGAHTHGTAASET